MDITNTDRTDAAWEKFQNKWLSEDLINPYDMDEQDFKTLGLYNPFHFEEMLYPYITTREGFLKDKELLSIERPFAIPLDPSEKHIFYTGRIDKEIKDDKGRIYPIDHKTTTKGGKNGLSFQQSWMEQWSPNSQIDGYMFASLLEHGRVDGAYIDGALVHRHQHDTFCLLPILRQTEVMNYWLWHSRNTVDLIEKNVLELEKLRSSKKIYSLPYMPVFHCDGSSCWDRCKWRDLCKSTTNPEKTWPVEEDPPLGFELRNDENNILNELGIE
jgi:hypothetical protein